MKPLEYGDTKAITGDGRVVEGLVFKESFITAEFAEFTRFWHLDGTYIIGKNRGHLNLFAYEEHTMKKQIPFDLDKALAGAQVQYRNGENLTRDDWHWFKNSSNNAFCLHTTYETYTKDGFRNTDKSKNEYDLMLEVDVEKVEGWVNVYPHMLHNSEESSKVSEASDCIGQAFISVEVDK